MSINKITNKKVKKAVVTAITTGMVMTSTVTPMIVNAAELTTPSAPSITMNDDDNTLSGIDATMEYQVDSGAWTDYDPGNPPDLTGDKEVKVRIKAVVGESNASPEVTCDFTTNLTSPDAPTVTADDENNDINGIDATMEFSVDGSDYITYDGSNLPDLSGDKEVKVRIKAIDGKSTESADTTLNFTANLSKPDAPIVSADDDGNVINGIDGTMEYKIDSGSWEDYDSSNAPDLSGAKEVKVRIKAVDGTSVVSEEVILNFTENLTTPSAPSVTADDENNAITGIDNTMEYKVDAGEWTTYDGSNAPDLTGNKTVLVRIKAIDGKSTESADTPLTFTANLSKPATPIVTVDDDTNVITGIDGTMEYKIGTGEWTDYDGGNIPDLTGNKEVKVRIKAIEGTSVASDEVTLTFTSNLTTPDAPTVTADDEKNIIVGLDETMEYSINGGAYLPCNLSDLPELLGGKEVKVRIKAVDGKSVASEDTTLTFTANEVVSEKELSSTSTILDVVDADHVTLNKEPNELCRGDVITLTGLVHVNSKIENGRICLQMPGGMELVDNTVMFDIFGDHPTTKTDVEVSNGFCVLESISDVDAEKDYSYQYSLKVKDDAVFTQEGETVEFGIALVYNLDNTKVDLNEHSFISKAITENGEAFRSIDIVLALDHVQSPTGEDREHKTAQKGDTMFLKSVVDLHKPFDSVEISTNLPKGVTVVPDSAKIVLNDGKEVDATVDVKEGKAIFNADLGSKDAQNIEVNFNMLTDNTVSEGTLGITLSAKMLDVDAEVIAENDSTIFCKVAGVEIKDPININTNVDSVENVIKGLDVGEIGVGATLSISSTLTIDTKCTGNNLSLTIPEGTELVDSKVIATSKDGVAVDIPVIVEDGTYSILKDVDTIETGEVTYSYKLKITDKVKTEVELSSDLQFTGTPDGSLDLNDSTDHLLFTIKAIEVITPEQKELKEVKVSIQDADDSKKFIDITPDNKAEYESLFTVKGKEDGKGFAMNQLHVTCIDTSDVDVTSVVTGVDWKVIDVDDSTKEVTEGIEWTGKDTTNPFLKITEDYNFDKDLMLTAYVYGEAKAEYRITAKLEACVAPEIVVSKAVAMIRTEVDGHAVYLDMSDEDIAKQVKAFFNGVKESTEDYVDVELAMQCLDEKGQMLGSNVGDVNWKVVDSSDKTKEITENLTWSDKTKTIVSLRFAKGFDFATPVSIEGYVLGEETPRFSYDVDFEAPVIGAEDVASMVTLIKVDETNTLEFGKDNEAIKDLFVVGDTPTEVTFSMKCLDKAESEITEEIPDLYFRVIDPTDPKVEINKGVTITNVSNGSRDITLTVTDEFDFDKNLRVQGCVDTKVLMDLTIPVKYESTLNAKNILKDSDFSGTPSEGKVLSDEWGSSETAEIEIVDIASVEGITPNDKITDGKTVSLAKGDIGQGIDLVDYAKYVEAGVVSFTLEGNAFSKVKDTKGNVSIEFFNKDKELLDTEGKTKEISLDGSTWSNLELEGAIPKGAYGISVSIENTNDEKVYLDNVNIGIKGESVRGGDGEIVSNIIPMTPLEPSTPVTPDKPVTPTEPTTPDKPSTGGGGHHHHGGGSSSSSSSSESKDKGSSSSVENEVKDSNRPKIELDKNDDKVEFNTDSVKELTKENKTVKIEKEGIKLELKSGALEEAENMIDSDSKVTLKVEELSSYKTEKVVDKALDGDKLKDIGSKIFDLSTEVKDKNNKVRSVKKFTEPVAIKMSLKDLGIKESDIDKLTGVRYEEKNGEMVAVKLGGQYDEDTKEFTFFTDKPELCSVVKAKEIKEIDLTIGRKDTKMNHITKNNDVAPQIINNRTMVPVRFIAENLGADVKWNGLTRTVTINQEGKTLKMTIDQIGEDMDTAPTIRDNRTLVPIRYISEKLNANVMWFPEDKAVKIVK